MTYVRPPFVSENEGSPHLYPDGTWDDAAIEDCVEASEQMAANATKPGSAPTTHAETEALRYAAGYPATGPTSTDRITPVANARYGTNLREVVSPADIAAQLAIEGMCAAVSGLPINTPLHSGFRDFYPYFPGNHCVYLANEGNPGQLMLLDPRGGSGYTGRQVSFADFKAFVTGSAAVGQIAQEASDMFNLGAGTVTIGPNGGRICKSHDLSTAISSKLPAGTKVTKLGGVSGWRDCVVVLGGVQTVASIPASDIGSETSDMALQSAIVAGSVPAIPTAVKLGSGLYQVS